MMRAPGSDLPIVFEKIGIRADATDILANIDLRIDAGGPTFLVGPNGSGKTTILRLAMALITPSGGEIFWGGKVEPTLGRQAIVFQRPVMLRRSAAANIAYVLGPFARFDRRCRAQIHNLLEDVGLAGLGGRPARRLSGGELQRLALAKALAQQPEILFLDEPTASLDPTATKSIEALIAKIAARGIKIVMSTHDLVQAKRLAADVVFLDKGRLVEHAPAARFFTEPASAEAREFLRGTYVI